MLTIYPHHPTMLVDELFHTDLTTAMVTYANGVLETGDRTSISLSRFVTDDYNKMVNDIRSGSGL